MKNSWGEAETKKIMNIVAGWLLCSVGNLTFIEFRPLQLDGGWSSRNNIKLFCVGAPLIPASTQLITEKQSGLKKYVVIINWKYSGGVVFRLDLNMHYMPIHSSRVNTVGYLEIGFASPCPIKFKINININLINSPPLCWRRRGNGLECSPRVSGFFCSANSC